MKKSISKLVIPLMIFLISLFGQLNNLSAKKPTILLITNQDKNPLADVTAKLVPFSNLKDTFKLKSDVKGKCVFLNLPDSNFKIFLSKSGFFFCPVIVHGDSVRLFSKIKDSNLIQTTMYDLLSTAYDSLLSSKGSKSMKAAEITCFKKPLFVRDQTNISSSGYTLQKTPVRGINYAVGTRSGANIRIRGSRGSGIVYYIDEVKVTGNSQPAMSIVSTPEYNNIITSCEQYKRIEENKWKNTSNDPLSTFSINVDNAAYANVRRIINEGHLPDIDAVRIEELINYFKYNFVNNENDNAICGQTEIAVCPWNINHKLVQIALKSKSMAKEQYSAQNLVFLIDVSGSMNEEIPLVKRSLNLLVDKLTDNDKISIVVYAGAAGLVLPATSGGNKSIIKQAIESLQAGGSTAGGQGIELAYQIAKNNFLTKGSNRVILCTDGDFNVGISSENDLIKLIESKRKDNVYLTCLGFGSGNYNDLTMQTLAEKGNGNYSYIDGTEEAKKVLVDEFGGTLFAKAKDVKIQVEFNPTLVKNYRLIGYESRLLNNEDFNNDKVDAGEIGSDQVVVALYEVSFTNEKHFESLIDSLKYSKLLSIYKPDLNQEVLTVKIRYKLLSDSISKKIDYVIKNNSKSFNEASENFRWASAVAYYGKVLRLQIMDKNNHEDDYNNILAIAKSNMTYDPNDYRKSFIKLVNKTKSLIYVKD